jgi:DNA invertase Pin-like site-specific DNA recombinase
VNWLRALFVGTIPRDVHDRIVSDLREQLRDERERSRRQMRTIIRMKVAGGSIPRALSGIALPPKPLTEIEQAILDALDANPKTKRPGELRNRHRAYAERTLARDASDTTLRRVLNELRTWGKVDDATEDDDDVIAVTTRG